MRKINAFVLEDDEERMKFFNKKSDGIWCPDVESAIVNFGEEASYEIIFLDHDLGGVQFQNVREFNCGTTFARYLDYLANKKLNDAGRKWLLGVPIIIHTLNFEAGKLMFSILGGAGFTSLHLIPFTTLRTSWDQIVAITS